MGTQSSSRQGRMSSSDRRAVILDTACKLFAEKGYRGTTTRELAAAAGVTEPVLYEHFRTKSDLYSAIIENMAQGGIEILTALSERYQDAKDPEEFFQALGDAILTWYIEDEAFIRLLLYSSLENHDLKSLFQERSARCFEIVRDYIGRCQASGCIRPDIAADVAAEGFFGMVAHYAQSQVVAKCRSLPYEPREAVAQMVHIYVSGMSTAPKAQE